MREERSAAGPAAEQSTLARVETSMLATAALLAPLLLDIESASAAGNPLLTGKTISLVHPLVMFGLLGSSIYTGVLGWNWRRTRLIPVGDSVMPGALKPPAGHATISVDRCMPGSANAPSLQWWQRQRMFEKPEMSYFVLLQCKRAC